MLASYVEQILASDNCTAHASRQTETRQKHIISVTRHYKAYILVYELFMITEQNVSELD